MTNHQISRDKDANVEVLAVTPRIAKRMLGCGTTRLYDLLNRGELQSYRDGKSRRIIVASLREYVGRQLAAEKAKDKSTCTAGATRARLTKKKAIGNYRKPRALPNT